MRWMLTDQTSVVTGRERPRGRLACRIAEAEALKKGMEEKSREFAEKWRKAASFTRRRELGNEAACRSH